MQLDSYTSRRREKYQRPIQKSREINDRNRSSYVFERMMDNRFKAIDETLRRIESRINAEVEQRVAAAVQDFMESDSIRNLIDQRVQALLETTAKSASSPLSSPGSSSIVDSEETISYASSTCAEPANSVITESEEASCSSLQDPILMESESHYPNKWEFITCLHSGEITDFRIEQFTDPVRASLKMTPDQDIFPRMSLEEMIERDHPTTYDSSLFDEKKISCKNRPQGKNLTDEEFFCLAPCCSDMRLYQAASCPFLPQFVRKRLNETDNCRVIVQRTANGIELITPIKWKLVQPIVPNQCLIPETPDVEEEVEDTEEEDPLLNPDIVEQLMHEYFLPTPPLPLDDLVFGPYLQRVRQSDVVPKSLLHDLLRRINSNLDNSYKTHQELELFSELDKVPIDEKYGRLPFTGN